MININKIFPFIISLFLGIQATHASPHISGIDDLWGDDDNIGLPLSPQDDDGVVDYPRPSREVRTHSRFYLPAGHEDAELPREPHPAHVAAAAAANMAADDEAKGQISSDGMAVLAALLDRVTELENSQVARTSTHDHENRLMSLEDRLKAKEKEIRALQALTRRQKEDIAFLSLQITRIENDRPTMSPLEARVTTLETQVNALATVTCALHEKFTHSQRTPYAITVQNLIRTMAFAIEDIRALQEEIARLKTQETLNLAAPARLGMLAPSAALTTLAAAASASSTPSSLSLPVSSSSSIPPSIQLSASFSTPPLPATTRPEAAFSAAQAPSTVRQAAKRQRSSDVPAASTPEEPAKRPA